ncbi:MAG: NAD(P)-dependent oxidoreductase [Patescibacteria group bacterium]
MITNLVIGSEGFIGKPFCKYLENKQEKAIRFDIKQNEKEDGRFFKFDFKKIDKIYFLAWDVGGSKYLYEPKLQMSQLKWNLALITNIFNQLEEQKKTDFLFVSSQLTEEADTVYGSTKRLGEVWTNLLKGVCVRVWNAYGVMEEQDIKSHVISDFIYQALQTGKITMMTNGQEWRQFTHINDLCNAFYMALNTKDLRKTVYDASSYEWVRIIDIAQIISDSTGAKLIPGKIKGHDPLPADNMGRVPGWLPSIELKDGIQKIVNQAKEILKNDKKE